MAMHNNFSKTTPNVITISVRHADAGDAVASPMLKNWPLFGQKISTLGQPTHLHSHISEIVYIFPTKAK